MVPGKQNSSNNAKTEAGKSGQSGLLNKNIKYLRKLQGATQEAFAADLGIKRSTLGAYEEGRARPNLSTQLAITKITGLSLDRLVMEDLERSGFQPAPSSQNEEKKGDAPEGFQAGAVRVLSIAVDKQDREQVVLVNEKARAGYASGYGDPEYVADLPSLDLPFLPAGTYRAFEITGDSMLPMQPGSIIIGEYVEDWTDFKDGLTYILLTKQDGIVYKRVFQAQENRQDQLVLQSDNPSYPPYELQAGELMEAWEAKLSIGKISRQSDASIDSMMGMLAKLQAEVREIQDKGKPN